MLGSGYFGDAGAAVAGNPLRTLSLSMREVRLIGRWQCLSIEGSQEFGRLNG